jgi:hypothetical protein
MNYTGFNTIKFQRPNQDFDMFGEKLEDPKDYFKQDELLVGKIYI